MEYSGNCGNDAGYEQGLSYKDIVTGTVEESEHRVYRVCDYKVSHGQGRGQDSGGGQESDGGQYWGRGQERGGGQDRGRGQERGGGQMRGGGQARGGYEWGGDPDRG